MSERPFKDPRLRLIFDDERRRRRAVEDARVLRDLAQTMHEVGEHEGARLFARECEKAVAIGTGVLQREARPARGCRS